MAGESLIPSPIYPTISPACLYAIIIFSFWLGLISAKISISKTFLLSWLIEYESSSSPNKIFSGLSPIWLPIFLAIRLLSPVIIFRETPNLFISAITSFISSFNGSTNSNRPTNTISSALWFLVSISSSINL